MYPTPNNALLTAMPGLVSIFDLTGGVNALARILFRNRLSMTIFLKVEFLYFISSFVLTKFKLLELWRFIRVHYKVLFRLNYYLVLITYSKIWS